MPYAAAGLDTTKQCLPGTRADIISQITNWINDKDAAQRVLWLSGPAGTGKSAIAHTIANWFKDLGELGSCFCFDRDLKDDKRHEKVFSTIARDLADRDPEMRRTLAHAVEHDNALKNTTDIIQQWHKLFMKPLENLSGSRLRPVLIVIEALDESGEVETRRDLLRILAGKLQEKDLPQITELPPNFRIFVTSRPLRDIDNEFRDARHIQRLSMDDIPEATSKRDIHTLVSHELKQVSGLGDKECGDLASKADGLFEWARLACKYIQHPPPGSYPIDRFNAVMSHDHGERRNLLYGMYSFILGENMGKDRYTNAEYQRALAKFHSVMGQILASVEPFRLDALNKMRSHFPDKGERYKVEVVVHYMGSLLSGTTNPSSPIRPLHASFREFLTDRSSSGDFFVDLSKSQHDLAFASLGVMEHDLRFNMCNLKSSHLPNSKDIGLQDRVTTSIPSHLSYSCRFWATHVQATAFNPELAKEIRSLFDHERLLFWIEALGLINALGSAVAVPPLISKWLKAQSGYKDVLSTAVDVRRFVQLFGGMILRSTPHLYVSALPFSPIKSTIATRFTARFPNTLRVIHGRLVNWTAIQTIISGHTGWVRSVSFSPDGTRIVSGSSDSTVRVWDAATGLPLGKPFRGHTESVWSVSFSPDGSRIVSGSWDSTVRVWDAATGLPLGEPFRGHTSWVSSVSFSPDGTRIMSGSEDSTVRVWDAATGLPFGEPFRGHTSSVSSVSFSPDGTRIVSGSRDSTVRVWNAATTQQFQEHTQIHSSASSLHRCHAICFASSLEHALHNPAELLETTPHEFNSTRLVMSNDGWMVGADRRLLFWVPFRTREQPLYHPGTVFVIPSGLEIDLSRMAHGECWANCRDAPTSQ
jgi:WD40 repeat protein